MGVRGHRARGVESQEERCAQGDECRGEGVRGAGSQG